MRHRPYMPLLRGGTMKDRDLSRLLEDMVARILAEQSHEQSVRKLYVVF